MKALYKTAEELEIACNAYFAECDKGQKVQVVRRGEAVDVIRAIPYTVPGLALSLGYSHRSSVWDLGQNPVHSDTIRRALSRIENQRVVKSLLGEQNERMSQFDLINNFGYKSSKQEVTVNQVGVLGDDEINQRLLALEGKMDRVSIPDHVDVIEGDFAVKLLD